MVCPCCVWLAEAGSDTKNNNNNNNVAQLNACPTPVQAPCPCIRRNDSPARSSPKDVLVEGGPKNDSRSRASGTGLTMKRRPAECTTCAATLGGTPVKVHKNQY